MTQCDYDGCAEPMRFRAYASYNADEGDADGFGSTRQWLIVLPRIDGDA